jgi:hypothetical protein
MRVEAVRNYAGPIAYERLYLEPIDFSYNYLPSDSHGFHSHSVTSFLICIPGVARDGSAMMGIRPTPIFVHGFHMPRG